MKVLVTAIGTISSTTIVQQLKKNKNIYIIGADINEREYVATSLDVDEYYQFPSVVDNEGYKDFLLNFCIMHKIKIIYAIIDEEVELLSKDKEEFISHGIIPMVADYDAVRICRDKYLTFQWIEKNVNSIWIPTNLLSSYLKDMDYPVFIKPRKGRASIGCRIVHNNSEMEALIIQLGDEAYNYLVQPVCSGINISADVIRSSETKYFQMVIREEVLRNKNGAAIAVKIIKDDVIEDICFRIAEGLDFVGVMNIELFYDKETRMYSLIEINPRFPAGTGFTCMAGLDLVNQYYRIVNNIKVVEQPVKIGATYARRYETYGTK